MDGSIQTTKQYCHESGTSRGENREVPEPRGSQSTCLHKSPKSSAHWCFAVAQIFLGQTV